MIYGTSVSMTKMDLAKVDAYCRQIQVKQSRPGSRDHKHRDTGKDQNDRYWNNFVGKLGELGAAKATGGTVDFAVWPTGFQGRDHFDPDVVAPSKDIFHGKHLHVKTCHTRWSTIHHGKIFPSARASWTVDARDPILVQPTNRDLLVLMFADEEGQVFSYGWVEATRIQSFWKPCASKFMSHKRALYLHDIKDLVKRV